MSGIPIFCTADERMEPKMLFFDAVIALDILIAEMSRC